MSDVPDPTPSSDTDDSSWYTAPDGVHADDLDTYQPSGDPYAGIPAFDGADFSTFEDARPSSVPGANGPASPLIPTMFNDPPFPSKDDD